MAIYYIAAAAFAFTMLGGLLALRLRDRLHLILGFSAGAVIGVAFFDLLPESLQLASGSAPADVLMITALGFVLYLAFDRALMLHGHSHDDEHAHSGIAGAATLALHSFLDGIGIGLAFHVSASVGFIVAAAVLTHDFSDGINTVGMILKNTGDRMRALKWLLLDAVAPVAGIMATLFFGVTDEHLGFLLALFAGFFLYIGASDLIPESHHRHPTLWTTVMTIAGVAVLWGAVRLAGI